MLWSFAAANDPCDKVRVSGTGLTRGKNQYQLHLYRRIVKTKCPGVLVSPVSANSFDWNFFFFFKAHTCFISNWPLTLMHAASRENRRQVCLVTMLHEASEKGFFLQSHRIRWVLASRVCAPQLGLIYATDKAVSLQHSTLWGSSRETAFQFISDGPSPGPHFRVFKAVESIDQHLKLGPTPLSQLRGYGDLASFLAPSPHYSFWPPALLVMLTLWYNYD